MYTQGEERGGGKSPPPLPGTKVPPYLWSPLLLNSYPNIDYIQATVSRKHTYILVKCMMISGLYKSYIEYFYCKMCGTCVIFILSPMTLIILFCMYVVNLLICYLWFVQTQCYCCTGNEYVMVRGNEVYGVHRDATVRCCCTGAACLARGDTVRCCCTGGPRPAPADTVRCCCTALPCQGAGRGGVHMYSTKRGASRLCEAEGSTYCILCEYCEICRYIDTSYYCCMYMCPVSCVVTAEILLLYGSLPLCHILNRVKPGEGKRWERGGGRSRGMGIQCTERTLVC